MSTMKEKLLGGVRVTFPMTHTNATQGYWVDTVYDQDMGGYALILDDRNKLHYVAVTSLEVTDTSV
jgi:hypothetical protein